MDPSMQSFETKIKLWREKQFPLLKDKKIYLDHAGAPLFSQNLINSIYEDIKNELPLNPHSNKAQQARIESIRAATLTFLGASSATYTLVWTSGATAALKLLGERFRWEAGSVFGYTTNNHTSVIGIREFNRLRSDHIFSFEVSEAFELSPETRKPRITSTQYVEKRINDYRSFAEKEQKKKPQINLQSPHLLAFNGESNFNGNRINIKRFTDIRKTVSSQSLSYMILLDAAKLAGSVPLQLDDWPIDFAVVSFYKIFGFPTGLGALLIRHSALQWLVTTKSSEIERPLYFGGGSIDIMSPESKFVVRKKQISAELEFGTPNTLAILSLSRCFDHAFRVDGETETTGNLLQQRAINCRQRFFSIIPYTFELQTYLIQALAQFKYRFNERACVLILGKHQKDLTEDVMYLPSGPVVAFVCLTPLGEIIPHPMIEKGSLERKVYLRTGCVCNIGGCLEDLGLTDTDLKDMFDEGHVCGDDIGMIRDLPTGCCRISIGFYNTRDDIDRFLQFLEQDILGLISRPLMQRKLAVVAFNPSLYKSILRSTSKDIIKYGSSRHTDIQSLVQDDPEIQSIWFYPIKGCQGVSVDYWVVCEQTKTLLWDRYFRLEAHPPNPPDSLTKKKNLTSVSRHLLVNVVTGLLFVVSHVTMSLERGPLQILSVYLVVDSKKTDKCLLIHLFHQNCVIPNTTTDHETLKSFLDSKLFQYRVLIPSQHFRLYDGNKKKRQFDTTDLVITHSGEGQLNALDSAAIQFWNCTLPVMTTIFDQMSQSQKKTATSCVWVISKNQFDSTIAKYAIVVTLDKLDSVIDWWTTVLDTPAVLTSWTNTPLGNHLSTRTTCRPPKTTQNLNHANSSNFLITNEATLIALGNTLNLNLEMERFRPNFVVKGTRTETELNWLLIGVIDPLTCCQCLSIEIERPCYRCSAIDVIPRNASTKKSQSMLLSLLASHAASKLGMTNNAPPIFGVLGKWKCMTGKFSVIGVGWKIKVEKLQIISQ